MAASKLLFIDTETGGLNPYKHDLLSLAAVVWENKLILDTFEVFISRDNYSVSPKAMEVNQISLDELRQKGVPEPDALQKFIEFIKTHFSLNEPITIAGHNIAFDIQFLKQIFYRNEVDMYAYFSYRTIDTASILRYLYLKGTIHEEVFSLDKALNYFQISAPVRHEALADAFLTAQLFSKLLEL